MKIFGCAYLMLIFILVSCVESSSDILIESTVDKATEGVIKPDEYWLENKIDCACVYLYFPELMTDGDRSIIIKGKLNECIFDSLTVKLDSSRITQLQGKLAYPVYEDFVSAACFNPHHGIVYFNKEKRIIGSTSICFMCDQVQGDGNFIAPDFYISLMDSIKMPYAFDMIKEDSIFKPYREIVRKKLIDKGYNVYD